jgi:hypothetical protein
MEQMIKQFKRVITSLLHWKLCHGTVFVFVAGLLKERFQGYLWGRFKPNKKCFNFVS